MADRNEVEWVALASGLHLPDATRAEAVVALRTTSDTRVRSHPLAVVTKTITRLRPAVMLEPLQRLLEHLSKILDSARQAEIDERYRRALDYEPVDRPPCVVCGPLPDDAPFKPYPLGECFGESGEDVVQRTGVALSTRASPCAIEIGDDLPLTIRANFGTVLIASMFGAAAEQIGDNPPWIRHDANPTSPSNRSPKVDPADMSRGWIPRVVEGARSSIKKRCLEMAQA